MEGKKLWLCSKECQKPKCGAIAKIIASCLNPIISTCVMIQSRGHWQLLDTLTTTIALIYMNMEVALLPLFGGFNFLIHLIMRSLFA